MDADLVVGIAARQWAFCPVFRNKLRNLWKDAVFAVPSNPFVVGRLMLASSWNLEWGKRLRAERERLGLSLRDVETLSHGIADKLQNSDYNIAHTSLADIENGKWPPTLHRLYTLSVDYDRLASMCGVPVGEVLKEHRKLGLPRTYLIGPAPESSKATIASAVELREKLRAERTNLLPKILETWDEVPLVLQLMDGRTRSMDISEWMTTPCTRSSAREPSFELTRGKRKFLPSIGIAMIVRSSSSNCASVTCAAGAKCTMAG